MSPVGGTESGLLGAYPSRGSVRIFVLFVLIPAVAGWITIFQLRGWGQIHGRRRAGLDRRCPRRRGTWCARGPSAQPPRRHQLPAVDGLRGLGPSSPVSDAGVQRFHRFASLGGLRLSVDTSTGTVALGVPVAVDIHLRNTSHQDYANVVMKGPFLHDCLPLDGDGFDVGMVAAGQDRQWSCTPPAGSELDHTFLFRHWRRHERATRRQPRRCSACRHRPHRVLIDPRWSARGKRKRFGVILVAGQDRTLTWRIRNIGDHRASLGYRLVDLGPALDAQQPVPNCEGRTATWIRATSYPRLYRRLRRFVHGAARGHSAGCPRQQRGDGHHRPPLTMTPTNPRRRCRSIGGWRPIPEVNSGVRTATTARRRSGYRHERFGAGDERHH